MKQVRGIRGAIKLKENSRTAIFGATKKLIEAIMDANDIRVEDIASVFFTATGDLDADYPAYAAREMGWIHVPLLCAREMDVPGGMNMVVRILMHVNSDKEQKEIQHQYLGETARLRPDITGGVQQ